MKKILLLCIALIAVIGITASGTWAYFFDTVSTTGNTLQAGTLELNGTNVVKIELGTDPGLTNTPWGLQPGDSGNAANWTLANSGSLDGILSVEIPTANFKDMENGSSAHEQDNGDTSDDDVVGGTQYGELGGLVYACIWLDTTASGVGDGNGDTEDYYLDPTAGIFVNFSADDTAISFATNPSIYFPLRDFSGKNFTDIDGAGTKFTVAGDNAGTLGHFRIDYQFTDHGNSAISSTTGFELGGGTSSTSANDNVAQSDKCLFDVTITLKQAEATRTISNLKSIAITAADTALATGDTTENFTATGTYSDGTTKDITSLVTWNGTVAGVLTITSGGSTPGRATYTVGTTGSTSVTATLAGVTSNSVSLTYAP